MIHLAVCACLLVNSAAQPVASAPEDAAPAKPALFTPSPPPVDGQGDQQAFLFSSIDVVGLEPTGVTLRDLQSKRIALEQTGVAWGRPSGQRIALGRLFKPDSPLCLYASEITAVCKEIREEVAEQGFAGIYVGPEPQDSSGRLTLKVTLITISRVEMTDLQDEGKPKLDLEALKRECPIQSGGYFRRPDLMRWLISLESRHGVHARSMIEADKSAKDVGIITIEFLTPKVPEEAPTPAPSPTP